MSDDDFFDSPRGGGTAGKCVWSRDETSEGQSTTLVSTEASHHRGIPQLSRSNSTSSEERGDKSRSHSRGKQSTGSDSSVSCGEKRYDQSKPSRSSSVQGSVTKMPTGKSRECHTENHSSVSDDEKTERSSRAVGKRTSCSSSGSTSGSNQYSRSSSRSRSLGSDEGSNTGSKQAWGVDSQSKTQGDKALTRPKTSHHRRIRRQRSNRSIEERDDKSRSHSRDSKRSGTSSSLTETESDITDVSPLNSPNWGYTPKTSPKKTKRVEIKDSPLSDRPPHSPMHKDLYSYAQDERKPRPKSAHTGGYEHLLQADSDSVNLKVLMQAILEMERDKEEKLQSRANKKFKVPHPAPSITGSISSQGSYGASRKNFSFTNTRVKDIDRENQRLMDKILKQGVKKKKPTVQQRSRQPMTASHRLTSSAVNRLKEQQRIDQDNRAMLKRLEAAKATKTLRKDDLNRELFNTTCAGVPLGIIHSLKTRSPSRPGSKSPYENSNRSGSVPSTRRAQSATSFRSDMSSMMSDGTYLSGSTVKSSGRAKSVGRTRPTSAPSATGKRGGSRVPNFRAKRPEWEAGW